MPVSEIPLEELPDRIRGLALGHARAERLGAETVGRRLRARLAVRDRAQPQVERGGERAGRDRGEVGLQVHAIDLGGKVRGKLVGARLLPAAQGRRPLRLGAGRGEQAPHLGDAAQPRGPVGPLGVQGVGARPARQGAESAVCGAQARRQC